MVAILFGSCYKLGATKGLMDVKVGGGSHIMWASEVLKTGNRKDTARCEISLQNNRLGRHK